LARNVDADGFERWSRACVDAAAELLGDAVPGVLGIEGAGRALTTAPGYQSRFVGLHHSQFGKLSLWLYVAPAGHAYSSRHAAQLGAGVMRSPQVNLQQAEGQWRFRSGNPFRWQALVGGWESYLVMETVHPGEDPAGAAGRLVPRVLLGLERADLIVRR
jgi:hypothetical protein